MVDGVLMACYSLAWCELYLIFASVFRRVDLELYSSRYVRTVTSSNNRSCCLFQPRGYEVQGALRRHFPGQPCPSLRQADVILSPHLARLERASMINLPDECKTMEFLHDVLLCTISHPCYRGINDETAQSRHMRCNPQRPTKAHESTNPPHSYSSRSPSASRTVCSSRCSAGRASPRLSCSHACSVTSGVAGC